MSYQATQWALTQAPRMTATERLVLACMAEATDEHGRGCFLSQSTIADRLYSNLRTVQRAVKALSDRELIRQGNLARLSHIPVHCRPAIWDLNLSIVRSESEGRSAKRESLRESPSVQAGSIAAQTIPPGDTPPPVICHPPVIDPTPPGISSDTPRQFVPAPPVPVSYKPPYEPPVEPPLEPSSPIRSDLERGFEEFWDAYPRKQGKGKAKEAFVKAAAKAGVEALIAGAVRYAGDPNLPEETYRPYPATWLNQERWDDAPQPTRISTSKTNTPDTRVEAVLQLKRPNDPAWNFDPATNQPLTGLAARVARKKAISA